MVLQEYSIGEKSLIDIYHLSWYNLTWGGVTLPYPELYPRVLPGLASFIPEYKLSRGKILSVSPFPNKRHQQSPYLLIKFPVNEYFYLLCLSDTILKMLERFL